MNVHAIDAGDQRFVSPFGDGDFNAVVQDKLIMISNTRNVIEIDQV